ncbi:MULTISPECIES: TlpA family protein disulfide reductase [Olivibacter]|uniref:TlpA family protein disulfide reductase n=1 Tax=Olivibacter jilunii TaxID=985016 RepID=A0ABW6B2X5_9SPHI
MNLPNRVIRLITCVLILETSVSIGQEFTPIAETKTNDTFFSEGDTLSRELREELKPYLGKPIILDFWATYCGACINAFPHLDELQKQFNDRAQIILVTNQSRETIENFAKRNKKYRTLSLPTVVSQKLWNSFSFRTIPLHVWITADGRVEHVTGGWNLNAERLEDFINGKKLNLTTLVQNRDFDKTADLWLEGNGRQNKYMQYYSFFMGYVPDAGGRTSVVKDKNTGILQKIKIWNGTLINMFAIAYGETTINNPFKRYNRVIIEAQNKNRFMMPSDKTEYDQWLSNNAFCYELYVPKEKSAEIFDFMRMDLERYFDLTASIEQREEPCFVLMNLLNNMEKIRTKGGKPSAYFRKENTINIQNRLMYVFMEELQDELATFSSLPLINETGFDGLLDIDFTRRPKDLKTINKELEKYGLQLKETVRKIEMLVIRDKDKNPSEV